MFRVISHPSSRAHNPVSTVSFTTGSSTCLINARYCKYSVMSYWWWVKYHPKHVERLTDLNKLYSVASCLIIIVILYDARSIEHKIYWCQTRTSKENCIQQVQLSGTTNYAVPVHPRSQQVAAQVSLMPDTVDTVLWADDGWRYHPKRVELLTDLNKLYSVASCCLHDCII